MTATRRVLAIPGSIRRDSLNLRLLEAARELAPATMAIEIYRELSTIPLFDADLEADDGSDDPPGVVGLRHAAARADGVLIATPEYNRAPPAAVKNVIDWLSRRDDGNLRGTPVATVGATPGPWGTRIAQATLAQMLVLAGAQVFTASAFYLARADRALQHARLVDDQARARLRTHLAAFDEWVATVGRASVAS